MKIGDLLSTGLGTRFRLAVIAPVSIPVMVAAALALSGAPRQRPDLCRLMEAIADLKTSRLVIVAALIAIVGALVTPLQLALIRFLEGYWGDGRFARWVSGVATRRQRRQMEALRADTQVQSDDPAAPFTIEQRTRVTRAAQLLSQRFPAETEILPTALGNALRAAERRAGDRYGLDAIVFWPRLYATMPKETRSVVNGARDELDLVAGLAVSFFASALVAAALTTQHGGVWRCLPLALLALAAFAYRSAVTSAIQYGVMVGVAFDLHRFELLAALHVPLPADSEAERALYAGVEKVIRGIPDVTTGKLPFLTFSHPDPKSVSSTEADTGHTSHAAASCEGEDEQDAGVR